jgi:hypothetical protein
VHAIYLENLLCKDRIVIMHVVLYLNFVPFLADPALSAVTPVSALFDVIVAQDPRKDDLIHVTSHWVFYEQLICDLVDAHKHKGKFTGRAFSCLFCRDAFSFLALTLHFEGFLLLEVVHVVLFVFLSRAGLHVSEVVKVVKTDFFKTVDFL